MQEWLAVAFGSAQLAGTLDACKPRRAIDPMISPAEADPLIAASVPDFLREDCPLAAAHGRVLRADLHADRDLPPFDRVTMDGYALRAAELANGRTVFQVEGTQAAGMRPLQLSGNSAACVEVMTGAMLPDGADTVVPYEDTQREGTQIVVRDGSLIAVGSSVHRRASDHRAGDLMVRAGTRLTGREIAVAAAIGAATLTVSARPRIAVVATGDELVDVASGVAPHQIRRSNDYALRAALIDAGYPDVERFHLRDVRHELDHLLWHILAEHDVVLITGGVSKGKFDFLPAALDAQGVRKILQGVAQRPGKPFWFGMSPRQKPVFALPGNPVSAYTCLHRYVLPALARASGATPTAAERVALAVPTMFLPPLTFFLPVKLSTGPRAERLATPCPANTSGDLAGLLDTDGFVELPAEQSDFPAGYLARFFPW